MRDSIKKGVPEGFHSVTASLTVDSAAAAIEYYRRAFGAVEVQRSPAPDGKKIWHAEVRIGDTLLMLNDAFPEMGGPPANTAGGHPFGFWLYVSDVDAVHAAAVAAGGYVELERRDAVLGRSDRLADRSLRLQLDHRDPRRGGVGGGAEASRRRLQRVRRGRRRPAEARSRAAY